jgi:outer membrane protein assembly factor BamB
VAWTSPALDGPVYGEPLVFRGQVFVATENDTVYALSAADGTVVWSDHVGSPVPAGALQCGNIAPSVGITSTMVIDPGTSTLFASAELSSGGAVSHELVAFDVTAHRRLWNRGLDQPGWTATAQLQRSALGLSDGNVLVGFGANYGDCGRYHGWVLGVPESGSGPLLAYRVASGNGGAVWAPAGVAADASGDVYAATGNTSAAPGASFDHANSVIELSPQLAEREYFAPTSWARDNESDADLGSTAPVLLGDGRVFVVGKAQTAYLLAATALGGVGGQLAQLDVCNSRGGSAYVAPDVYVVCPDDGTIAQVRVGPGAHLSRGWTWSSPTGGTGSPTVAGGVVWTVDPGASVLYGVDASTGSTRYSQALRTGPPSHFAAPAAAGGTVVVAGDRAVEAFR